MYGEHEGIGRLFPYVLKQAARNKAVILKSALMRKLVLDSLELKSPDHPIKANPSAGVATRFTLAFWSYSPVPKTVPFPSDVKSTINGGSCAKQSTGFKNVIKPKNRLTNRNFGIMAKSLRFIDTIELII